MHSLTDMYFNFNLINFLETSAIVIEIEPPSDQDHEFIDIDMNAEHATQFGNQRW